MTPERWRQIKEGFFRCLDVPPEGRATLLGTLGSTDPELRSEIEQLLELHHDAEQGAFLARGPMPPTSPDLAPADLQGRRLGAYRLLGEIGHGGMGVVYRATRVDDEFQKEVAIKVVSGGRDVQMVKQRFLIERQILATLEHPFIARLLDGGTTEEGLPYLVMELVDGQPLTDYAHARGLDVPARLRLFRDICAAVHHAHQHLVVHRDLKPSNILVTAEGVPKLLDFGIARLIEPGGPGDRTQTVFRALTPEYASPEQLRGLPVTTASDVYSLGVVLFELLCDERPWSMEDGPPPGPEDVFGPPSARLARRAPGSTPEDAKALRHRRRLLEGDLDTIVLMALRHEPERRYRSVDQMSDDVRRHLEARPVLARPDTIRYRAGKMIRRNPTAAVAMALLALGLTAGVTAALWQASVARAERRRAEQRFDEVRRLAGTLVFELHDAIKDLPGSTRARALVLERARQHLDGLAGGSNDPSLQRELAAAYLKLGSLQGSSRDANLGSTSAALVSYRKALDLQDRALAQSPRDAQTRRERAAIALALSSVLRDRGAEAEADVHDRQAADTINDLVREHPEDVTLRSDLAAAYERLGFNAKGDLPAALAAHRRSLALYQEVALARPEDKESQRRLAIAHKHVGAVLIVQHLLSEALAQYEAALAVEERTQGPHDARALYDASFTHSDIGYIHWKAGDRPQALASYRRALALREGIANADPSDQRARGGVARTLGYIGAVLLDDGQPAASIATLQRSLAMLEGLHAADPQNLRTRFDLASQRFGLARAQMAVAQAPGTPASRRTQAWTAARLQLELAQPVYMDEQKRGQLIGDNVDDLRLIAEALARCRTELAHR